MADYKEVKLMVKSILGSSKNLMTQHQLCKEYRTLIGSPLPYKQFGFNDSDSFLKTLTDTCIVTGFGDQATITPILSSDSKHIVNLIAHQKDNSKHRGFKVRNNPIFIQRQQNPLVIPQRPQINLPSRPPLLQLSIKPGIISNPTKLHSPTMRFHHLPQMPPISIASTSKLYTTHKRCNRSNKSDKNSGENCTKACGLEATTNYKVPFEIQNNLEALIKKFPGGLWMHDLSKEYFKEYNANIVYSKYGYTSLVQMCGSLETIFKYKHLPLDRGKLYYAKADIPNDASESSIAIPVDESIACAVESSSAKALPDNIDLDYDDEYPPFVMLFGDVIAMTTIPTCDATLYVPIVIGEVYDLSKFWFRSVENDVSLKELHKEMASYYDENFQSYQIPKKLLVQGLYVVIYRGASIYNRGVVTEFQDATVRVFCVDDGEVLDSSLSNIFFMHKQFSDLPKQAMRGRLARLIPPHKQAQWTRDASYRFLELVNNRVLQGSVDCIDESQTDNIYDLVLCDASHEHDIFIHDVLIGEEHAISMDQNQREPLDDVYGNFQPIVQDMHLYPLFIEIEMGVVPKAIDMRHLVGLNISLPEIYPVYFKPKVMTSEPCCSSYRVNDDEIKLIDSSSQANTNISSSLEANTTHSVKPSVFDIPIKLESRLGLQERLSPTPAFNQIPLQSKLDTNYGFRPGLKPTIPVPPNTHITQLLHLQEIPAFYDALCNEVDYLTRQIQMLRHQQFQLRFDQNTIQSNTNTIRPQFPRPSNDSNVYCRTQNIPNINPSEYLTDDLSMSGVAHNLSIRQDVNRLFYGGDMVSRPSTSSGFSEASTVYNARPKKYIYTEKIFDKYIHIVGFMQVPCIIVSEIQKCFTRRDDPILLRRLLAMSGIKLSDVCIDTISPVFLRQLEEEDLVGNSIRVTYTNLGNLEELISCITNSKCSIQDFQSIVAYYSRRSLWDIE